MTESAAIACRARGYAPTMLNSPLTGEARHVGTQLAQRTAEAAPTVRRAWIGTGETTVQVRGGGRGGRNQEVALAAAIALDGCEGVCVMSVGSDGRDGPTDAAGAAVIPSLRFLCHVHHHSGSNMSMRTLSAYEASIACRTVSAILAQPLDLKFALTTTMQISNRP
jgi:glycerate-2-kinase